MASYGNFQNDNNKYTNKLTRVNVNNPAFNPSIMVNGRKSKSKFMRNQEKWAKLVAYYRWFPDLWYDLITPETGGIRLGLDQRVLLRAMARFQSVYAVYNRGYSKTLLMVLSKIHRCVFFPQIHVTMTAQTKERSAENLKEKYEEVIRLYPLLKEEIYSVKFSKDTSEIEFHNGSRYDNLANNSQSKGKRRHSGDIDEDNLTDDFVFKDALEPIFNVPRRTIGKLGIKDPFELNGQINFFTSAGYRMNSAYFRCRKRLDGMINLTGDFCIGAGWRLGAFYGRGEAVSTILNKKKDLTSTTWAMNYESHWTGATDNALVSSSKLLSCRNLIKAEIEFNANDEYILGIDVARSDDAQNNQTVVTILKIVRWKDNRIKELQVVNIIVCSGVLNFNAQAIEVKRIKNRYNASYIVIDENGLGRGLTDELVRQQVDPLSGEILECYDTLNSERIPEVSGSPKIVFCYYAQKFDNEAIGYFIDVVETQKLRLLMQKTDNGYDKIGSEEYMKEVLPFIQTNFLIDEIVNLRLKKLSNGSLSVEKVVSTVDKDRYSSLLYAIWYAYKHLNNVIIESGNDLDYLAKYIKW